MVWLARRLLGGERVELRLPVDLGAAAPEPTRGCSGLEAVFGGSHQVRPLRMEASGGFNHVPILSSRLPSMSRPAIAASLGGTSVTSVAGIFSRHPFNTLFQRFGGINATNHVVPGIRPHVNFYLLT